MSLQPISCLLWDVDGTLVDTTSLIVKALDHVYRMFFDRTLPPDEIRALIGTPLKNQVRVFGDLEAFGVTEAQVLGEFIQFYEGHKQEEQVLFPVTRLVREGKERGIPTGIVTSKNREELNNTLPRLGIADRIDFAVTADDVAQPKPAPEGMHLALTHLAIPQEKWGQAVYIGDTVHDMRAAQAAGVRAVAVTWGAAPRTRLEEENPTLLCDTPEQLRIALHG